MDMLVDIQSHPRAYRLERKIKPNYADVSERFKVEVLKTSVRKHRGFKSYRPRQWGYSSIGRASGC